MDGSMAIDARPAGPVGGVAVPTAAVAPLLTQSLGLPMARGSFVEVRQLDPRRSSRLVGLATAGVVAWAANLLLSVVFRMAVGPIERGHLTQAVVAAVLVLGPTVWLVLSAARSTRPGVRPFVLAAVAVMILAALPVIGADWLGSFVTLAALVLIGVRPPWSLLLFAVVAVAPWPLSVAFGHGNWAVY